MDSIISAVLFLWSLGVPIYEVQVKDYRNDGVGGVACHKDFRIVDGNAQSLCPDNFTGMIIYGTPVFERAVEVVAHESYHLQNVTKGLDSDPFREREATNYGLYYRGLVNVR